MSRPASVIAILCALYCIGFCVVFQDCGSHGGNLTTVSSPECKDTDEKCVFVRGTNSTLSVKFIPTSCIFYLNANVLAMKYNIPVPFHLYHTSLCQDPDSGLRCPLCVHKEYSFNVTMFVQPQFPNDFHEVDVAWEFYNNHGMTILCIQFSAEIKRANTTKYADTTKYAKQKFKDTYYEYNL